MLQRKPTPNARKRARRSDVKATVAELQKSVKEKLAKTIEANFEWATEKLMSSASAELDLRKIKASDRIRAIEVLAKLHGWYAPEKTNPQRPQTRSAERRQSDGRRTAEAGERKARQDNRGQ